MVDNISSQDAENARLRSEYLKDSNKAMEYSRDLAKEMASFVKEEFLYQEGIVEDKRTSKDLGDQIAKQAKIANAAQKQAMVEFKKGNKDLLNYYVRKNLNYRDNDEIVIIYD